MKITEKYNLTALVNNDLLMRIQQLLRDGWFVRPEDGKITIHKTIDTSTPWIYVHRYPKRECLLSHRVLFQTFNVLPERCLSCWKVVVRPNTVKELFQLHDLIEELGEYGKCGIEERPYVPANYGGYFYTDSKEEGLVRLKQVRDAVNGISPDIPVVLKRGCTEMELKRKDWEQNDNDRKWEKIARRWFDIEGSDADQPDWIKINVMYRWLKFAYERGDKTANEFNGGNPIVTPSITYGEDK